MSNWGTDYRSVDPMELETRVSNADVAFLKMIVAEAPSPQAEKNLERIRECLDQLPDVEADFVDLYFFRHLKQTSISQIYAISQPSVCYRLQRAAKRIRFFLQAPEVTEQEIREALTPVLKRPMDVDMMVYIHETTCQSKAAQRLNESQGLVRHRFVRALEILREHPELEKFAELFTLISSNLNIKREVQRKGKTQVRYRLD